MAGWLTSSLAAVTPTLSLAHRRQAITTTAERIGQPVHEMEIDMSTFNAQEVGFLQKHLLGRLATSGKSGKPHVVPIRYHFDPEHEVIKIGGFSLEVRGQDRLYVRHLNANPQAALVVDDVQDEQTWQPRGVLIKGTTVLHTEGGEVLGQGFGPNWVEIVPNFVTSWGIDTPTV